MIEHSPEIKELASALLKFQGAVEGVKRDASNPHFRSRYASLEAVIDTARPALQEVGIVFTQAPGRIASNTIEMTTMLIHAPSGQWMRSTMQIALGKLDPQGVGSATTYSARYSLMATLGLPPTDDDAEAATDRSAPKPTPAPPPSYPKAAPPSVKPPMSLADEMIAEVNRRPKVVSLMSLRESDRFCADLESLDEADQKRVREAVAARKAHLLQAGL